MTSAIRGSKIYFRRSNNFFQEADQKKVQAFALVILTPANEVGNASRTRDGAKMKG